MPGLTHRLGIAAFGGDSLRRRERRAIFFRVSEMLSHLAKENRSMPATFKDGQDDGRFDRSSSIGESLNHPADKLRVPFAAGRRRHLTLGELGGYATQGKKGAQAPPVQPRVVFSAESSEGNNAGHEVAPLLVGDSFSPHGARASTPDIKVVFTSYSDELGARANVELQRAIRSPIYRGIFARTVIGLDG
jgi:hypothetical protein